jgi:GxxExxY protein
LTTTEHAEHAETKKRTDDQGKGFGVREINEVTGAVIGAAIEVHRALGPGLLESTYQACLVYELRQRGLHVEYEKPLPVVYKRVKLDCGYRIDLLVDHSVIVELKAVDQIIPIHLAQLLSYLKLPGKPVGLLINFNVDILIEGVRRVANQYTGP